MKVSFQPALLIERKKNRRKTLMYCAFKYFLKCNDHHFMIQVADVKI